MNLDKDMRIIATATHCSVSIKTDQVKGVAEADFVDPDWWISRVLINPKEARGQGVGGILLERLHKVVRKQGGKRIYVIPGGYDGKKKQQRKFYRNHGYNYIGAGILKVKL